MRDKLPPDVVKLIDAARLDPGAPFEPDALELLSGLRADDPAAWARFRDAMKGAVPLAELARLTAPAGGDDNKQGRPVTWDDPEPWPEPVDGAELIKGVSAFIRRHVWIDEPRADALALWAVMTWIHDRLEISTFANLTSSTKRCGKSLLLEVLAQLGYHRMVISGRISEAVLFRMVEAHEPTLMLDEADSYGARCGGEVAAGPDSRNRPRWWPRSGARATLAPGCSRSVSVERRKPNPLRSERKRLLSDSFYTDRGEIATLCATFRRMRGAIGARFGG